MGGPKTRMKMLDVLFPSFFKDRKPQSYSQPRVRAVCNWTDSAALNEKILHQSLPTQCSDLSFVADDSYDWLVVINDKREFQPRVPKERTIGFIQEPPDHDFFDREIGSYCSVVYTCAHPSSYGLKGNLVPFPCGMFYQMEGPLTRYLSASPAKPKSKTLSMITSGASHGFYLNRVKLARELARAGNADVFGRGLDVGQGELRDKASGLLPYRFSICMENGIWPGYVSDKIIDAVLCRTVPIYVGAPDVLEHIPFALPLHNYKDPGAALKEVREILNSVTPATLEESMREWVIKYAQEYTIHSKIRATILK